MPWRKVFVFSKARPRVHLFILFLTAFTLLVHLLCWIFYVTHRRDEVGTAGVQTYVVFVSVSMVVFFLVSSPFIFWPYAYGSEMSPAARKNSLCIGLVISFFLHAFPMTWLEIWLVWRFGWAQVLQTISLFLSLLCFIIGFFTSWVWYTWKVSKILQTYFGNAAPSQHITSVSAVSRLRPEQRI